MSFACLKMFFLSLVFGSFTTPCSAVHSFLMSLLGVRRLLESWAECFSVKHPSGCKVWSHLNRERLMERMINSERGEL